MHLKRREAHRTIGDAIKVMHETVQLGRLLGRRRVHVQRRKVDIRRKIPAALGPGIGIEGSEEGVREKRCNCLALQRELGKGERK